MDSIDPELYCNLFILFILTSLTISRPQVSLGFKPRLFAKSMDLKVHKIKNFFGSEFEFYTISLLGMLKY
jgi:hypothetical protein